MLLWDDRGSTSFVLTAITLGVVVVGLIIVSNVWKTPHHKVMLAWDHDAMPADWGGTAALLQHQLFLVALGSL